MVISNMEAHNMDGLPFGETDSSTAHEAHRKNDHASMMAEMFLGVANNFIAIGGGFFVKIKTHDSFREYDELVQVIEDQNAKNVHRLKLDADDRAMLRPLLAAVLKQRGKVITPEQQLLIACVSILIKKAQLVMQMRAENLVLVDRMVEIINASKEERDSVEFSGEVEPENLHLDEDQDEGAEELEAPYANRSERRRAERAARKEKGEKPEHSEEEVKTEKLHLDEDEDEGAEEVEAPYANRSERRRAERMARKEKSEKPEHSGEEVEPVIEAKPEESSEAEPVENQEETTGLESGG